MGMINFEMTDPELEQVNNVLPENAQMQHLHTRVPVQCLRLLAYNKSHKK